MKYSYEEMGNGFKFVLYRNSDIKNVTKDVTKDVTKTSLTQTEQSVYEVIKQTPTITRDEIAERIAKTVRTVQRSLNALRDKGYIDREGNRTKGLWIILKYICVRLAKSLSIKHKYAALSVKAEDLLTSDREQRWLNVVLGKR